MMERRQVVSLWREGLGDDSGGGGVLVTLVRVEGSSYRRAGARLLTASATSSASSACDRYAGTVSGGCLEAEVVRRAGWKVREGAVVETYSMRFDDTAEIPFGLGCGGTVDLLFESVGNPEGWALMEAMARSLDGIPSTVVSFLPGGGRGLRRLVLGAGGEVVFASAALTAEKIACALKLEPGRTYEGRFVERFDPPQRLIVCGAGDDAKPVVRMAAMLGWTVTVADGRGALARGERFPEAAQVVQAESLRDFQVTAADAVVLMTHSYEQDRALLISAIPAKPRYLGLLGARHRSSLLLTEAAAALGRTLEDCCEGVSAPVGMDLGGDGPEAIALAIVAEIQAMLHGRPGPSRGLAPGEIRGHVARGGAEPYLRVPCELVAQTDVKA